jgi:hypothetical protein
MILRGALDLTEKFEYANVANLRVVETIGDGTCMIHAILQAISPEYRQSREPRKKQMAHEVRSHLNDVMGYPNPIFDDSDEKATMYLGAVNGDMELCPRYLMEGEGFTDKEADKVSIDKLITFLGRTHLLESVGADGSTVFVGNKSLAGLLRIVGNIDGEGFEEECDRYERWMNGERDVYSDDVELSGTAESSMYFYRRLTPTQAKSFREAMSDSHIFDMRDRAKLQRFPVTSFFTTALQGNLMYDQIPPAIEDIKIDRVRNIVSRKTEYLELPHLYLLAQMFDVNIFCLLTQTYRRDNKKVSRAHLTLAPASTANAPCIFLKTADLHYETLVYKEEQSEIERSEEQSEENYRLIVIEESDDSDEESEEEELIYHSEEENEGYEESDDEYTTVFSYDHILVQTILQNLRDTHPTEYFPPPGRVLEVLAEGEYQTTSRYYPFSEYPIVPTVVTL